jgi:dTDP-glucose 4,6-dehydratase
MKDSMRKLLVTGGAGFIGSNFIRYWLQAHPEDTIVNLDVLTYAGNLENLKECESNPQYHFVKGDICDAELVNSLMADATHVVHFAAESHVDRSIINPGAFVQTNVMGTLILLQAAVAQKISHFHHISTDEVFGSLPLGTDAKFTDSTAYDPRSPYAASKAGSDHLVRAYGETFGLPFTLTNCSNNYGEYQFPEKLIPLAITNCIDNKPIPVYGDGLNIRDWLYVQDHCTAIDAVLTKGTVGKTYLVGGMLKDVPNIEIAQMIIHAFGKDQSMIQFVTDRPGHDRKYSVDWNTIHTELGWQPSVTLEEGLQKTIAWYTQHEGWWRPLLTKNKQYFETQYNSR